MPDLTEEEYDALDELWTKTTPKLGPNGSGFISRRELRLMGLDDLSRDYLAARASFLWEWLSGGRSSSEAAGRRLASRPCEPGGGKPLRLSKRCAVMFIIGTVYYS
jgi:hypothetical protein